MFGRRKKGLRFPNGIPRAPIFGATDPGLRRVAEDRFDIFPEEPDVVWRMGTENLRVLGLDIPPGVYPARIEVVEGWTDG